MDNTLTWKGFTYTVKPFTLDTLFALYEAIGNSVTSGRTIRDSFKHSCTALLEGTTAEARKFLSSGDLAQAILTCSDEQELEAAMEFKERVDFFSQSYTERGLKLRKSAPDLIDKLTPKAPEASAPLSPKATKRGRAHSG